MMRKAPHNMAAQRTRGNAALRNCLVSARRWLLRYISFTYRHINFMYKYSSLLILLLSVDVSAMTCLRQEVNELLKSSDYIFTGKVTSRVKVNSEPSEFCWEEGESCGTKIATFEIFDVLKGNISSGIRIQSQDACYCLGTYFHSGEHYLVFANNSEGSSVLEDVGGCATEELGAAISEGVLVELNSETSQDVNYLNEDVIGVWISFNDEGDIEMEGIKKIQLEFKQKYGFQAEATNENGTVKMYNGVHYIIGKELVAFDEDGYQPHTFERVGDYLILKSTDGQYRYKLRKI